MHTAFATEQAFFTLTNEVVNSVGPKAELTDYHGAIKTLNDSLKLGWDAVDQKVLTLLLTQLQKAYRFGSEFHMEPQFGENSAVHSIHTVIKWNMVFNRAASASGDEEAFKGDPQIQHLRLLGSLALILHDVGEIFGELSSLAQRSHAGVEDDQKENIEYTFFRYAVYKAYEAVEKNDEEGFHRAIEGVRKELDIKGGAVSDALEEDIKTHLPPLPKLSPKAKERAEKLLTAFRIIEGLEAGELEPAEEWLRAAAKLIEKDEGTAHFIRFRTYDPSNPDITLFYVFHSKGTSMPQSARSSANGAAEEVAERSIPFEYASERRVRSSLRYCEGPIPDLITAAHKVAPDSSLQWLHKEVIRGHYLRMLEWANRAPPVLDRKLDQTPSEIKVEADGRIQAARRNIHSEVQAIFLSASEEISAYRGAKGVDPYRTVAFLNYCCQRALEEVGNGAHTGSLSTRDVLKEVRELRREAQAILLTRHREARAVQRTLRQDSAVSERENGGNEVILLGLSLELSLWI